MKRVNNASFIITPIQILLAMLTFTSNFICIDSFSTSKPNNNQRRNLSASANTNTNTNNDVEAKIRQAMVLSNKGQQNISDAYLATSLWEEILHSKKNINNIDDNNDDDDDDDDDSSFVMSAKVKRICNVLYAAVLTRIGRDTDAIHVYDETLKFIQGETNNDVDDSNLSFWIDIKIAKGEALQRLMKYNEARNEFHLVWKKCCISNNSKGNNIMIIQEKLSQCVYKAALCSMRCNDVNGAREILTLEYNRMKDYHGRDRQYNDNDDDQSLNILGFLGILESVTERSLYEKQQNTRNSKAIIQSSGLKKLHIAKESNVASPIYKWFYSLLVPLMNSNDNNLPVLSNEIDLTKEENLSKLSSINVSPFDDPMLVYLDDKVLLHELLSKYKSYTGVFWPRGFILPDDGERFLKSSSNREQKNVMVDVEEDKKEKEELEWILKKRAGYGSHGNHIVSTNDAVSFASDYFSSTGDKMLCQQIIQPTLLHEEGKRFSLRVYVVYFSSEQSSSLSSKPPSGSSVYLSSIGLMKLALAEVTTNYDTNEDVNNAYMTNSGRASDNNEVEVQYDFDYLQQFINASFGNGAFENMWNLITSSVVHVMGSYLEMKSMNTSLSLSHEHEFIWSTVPKILGFDYIIDTSLNPWLLEVNRFPGLEARGGEDLQVKTALVRDVWELAKVKHTSSDEEMKSFINKSIFQEIMM